VAESKPPELSLVYADPQGRPRVYSIPEGTTTLGRARDNDLVLDDPTVTAHHVVIFRDGEKLELRDLFSGETLVNEQKRRNGVLAAGDVLSLGQVRLRIMKVVPRRAPDARGAGAPSASKMTDRLPRPEPATQRMLRPQAAAAELNASAASSRPAPVKSDRSTTAALPRPDLPLEVRDEPPPPRTPATAALPRPTPPPAAVTPSASDELRALHEREARREKQLQRARQLSDEMLTEDDFEVILEHIALGFLDVFSADRAVTVLFEEDGRNPLLTVERRRDGTDDGTGVAQEIVDRCLQVRSVIKIAGGHQGLGGLAAPLLSKGKAVGLLYFERTTASGQALDSIDVHVMAILSNQAAVVIAPLVV
jgi:hypothetical protein